MVRAHESELDRQASQYPAPAPDSSHRRKKPKRTGRFRQETKNKLREATGHRCEVCGGKGHQVHHDKPRSKGGRGTVDNAVVVCGDCHRVADRWARMGISVKQLLQFRLERTTNPRVVRRRPI